MRPWMAAAVLLCVLAASARAQDAGDDEVLPPVGELEREVRVVAAGTRRPLASARVRRYTEMTSPPAAFLRAWKADAGGVLRIDASEWKAGTHWIYDAPGFAPIHDYGELPHHGEQEMRPVRDLTVRVLDGLGRPAAGALVDGFDGCGHAPSMVVVRTAADGRATLAGVDPGTVLLWVVAEGLTSDYTDTHGRGVIDGRTGEWVVVQEPGGVCEGVVEDGEGRPLEGAWLHVPGNDRGPEAWTGPDGRFRLVGGAHDGELTLCHPVAEDSVALRHAHVEWTSGHALRIPLTPRGFAWDAETLRKVRVRVKDEAGALAERGVVGIRLADGRTWEASEEARDLPVGAYRFQAESSGGELAITPRDVEVAPGEGELVVDLTAHPRPLLRVLGGIPAGARADLALPDREEQLGKDDLSEARVAIDADAPAAVRVVFLDAAFFFPVGPAKDGVRTAEVDVPRPHRIGIRAPNPAEVELLRDRHRVPIEEEDGVVTTYARGDLVLRFRSGGLFHEVPVTLPGGEGTDREIGLPSPEEIAKRLVVVRLPDLGGESVDVAAEDGFGATVLASAQYDAANPPRFVFTGPVTVVVRPELHPQRLIDVTGPGVATAAWDAASLVLHVREADGAPAEGAEVRIGVDTWVTDERGDVMVPGIRSAALVLDVRPEDARRAGRRVRLPASDAAVRERTVVLPAEE